MADSTTMPDHALRQVGPLFLRYQSADLTFHLHWVGLRRPVKTSAQSSKVRVYRNAWYTKGMAQHHVGGLATYSWKQYQLIQCSWYLSLEVGDDLHSQSFDAFGFGSEESGGVNHGLEVMEVGSRECFDVWVPREKCRGHSIYPLVRALGRQDGRHQKLKWIGKVEFAMNVWIARAKDFVDGSGLPNRKRVNHHPTKITRLVRKGVILAAIS